MRNFIIIAATVFALAAGGAQAKSCKDAKGHFTKCPAATSVATPMTAAEMKAAPKKLSKADAKNELAAVQAPPAATATPVPAKKGVGLMGMFKPKGAAPGTAATPMAATSSSPVAATMLPAGHPVCKKGKPCGNSCIAQNKVCHKT